MFIYKGVLHVTLSLMVECHRSLMEMEVQVLWCHLKNPMNMFVLKRKGYILACSEKPGAKCTHFPDELPTYIGRSFKKIDHLTLKSYVQGGIRYSEKRRQQLTIRMVVKHPTPMRLKTILGANRFIDKLKIFTDN